MKLDDMQAKLDELKTVNESELTEEQKTEIQTLSTDIETETKSVERFDELSKKDEAVLTSEEVDELIQLEEKYAGEGKPKSAKDTSPKTKYAGKYDTVDELLKGINSSEQEKERILKDHPEAIEALEEKYKGSQRDVTKIIQKTKKPPVRHPSTVPLDQRELHEMTQPEYDTWEKKDKLAAHTWLSNATRKESSKVDSRKKVFTKYPQFFAMAQGVVTADEKWKVFDRIAADNPEWFGEVNGAELCMEAMEKELKIVPATKPKAKPTVLKPGFEQGKTKTPKPGKGKVLSEAEFAQLSSEDQEAYMENSVL